MTRRREEAKKIKKNSFAIQSHYKAISRKVRIENGRIFDVIAWKFLWIAINYCGFHVENKHITVFFFLIFLK